MNSLDFEKGRAEDKCVDFKSNIIKTNLEDCYIIEENRFGDDRGYFTSKRRMFATLIPQYGLFRHYLGGTLVYFINLRATLLCGV